MTACDLTQRLRQGDTEALAAVYRQYVTPVWQYACYTLGGQRDAADDVTANVFLAMVAGASRFDPDRATIEAWLFGIARRKLADHLRLHYRHRRQARQLRDLAWPSGDHEWPCQTSSREDQQAVAAALGTLPTPQRQVLVWKYCDALSVERIAQRLGRSPKAVENLLYRARQRFRQMLQPPNGQDPAAANAKRPAPAHEVIEP